MKKALLCLGLLGLLLAAPMAKAQTGSKADWKKFDRTFVKIADGEGNVACLSYDGRNCDFSNPSSVPTGKVIKPLVCGKAHKAQWGISGYDTARHWCNSAFSLFASWTPFEGRITALNPEGDVMCLSANGVECLSSGSVPPSKIIPLVCGKIHKEYYKDDGYVHESHWCNKARKVFTVAVTSDPQYPWVNEGGVPSSGSAEVDSKISIPLIYNSINNYHASKKLAGVIVNGDVTAYGHDWQWNYMHGILASVAPPLMLSLGNHDIENNVNDCFQNGCLKNSFDALEKYTAYFASSFDREIKYYFDRTGLGVREYHGSFAWSRDVGRVHFVFLNNEPTYQFTANGWDFAAARKTVFNIKSAVPWLEKDLKAARKAGKAIVLVSHKPFSEIRRADGVTLETLRKMVRDYEVSAIFLGHLHSLGGHVSEFGGAKVIYSGSVSTRTYLMVDFNEDLKKADAYLVTNGEVDKRRRIDSIALKTPIKEVP